MRAMILGTYIKTSLFLLYAMQKRTPGSFPCSSYATLATTFLATVASGYISTKDMKPFETKISFDFCDLLQ